MDDLVQAIGMNGISKRRLNMVVKRRAGVVGIVPDDASITRLAGAIPLHQTDEWQMRRRTMSLETVARRTDERPATLTHIAA